MDYIKNHIKIKSNWFNKYNGTFIKMEFKGLFLYFTLYKFFLGEYKLSNVRNLKKNEMDKDINLFITSIGMLKEEMEQKSIENRQRVRYTKEEILELLKTMERIGAIEIVNKSRWDQLLKGDGKVDDNRILKIIASDFPQTTRDHKKEVDVPNTKDDYFLPIDLRLLDYYLLAGLTERHYPIYCIIRKMTNNFETKSWMTIDTMSEHLGMDKDSINRLIHDLNRKYLLYSHKRKRKDSQGYRFEHFICGNYSSLKSFRERYEKEIEKNINKWNKVNQHKGRIKKSEYVPDFDIMESNEQVEAVKGEDEPWGEEDPFAKFDHNFASLQYAAVEEKVIEDKSNPQKENREVYNMLNKYKDMDHPF